MQIDFTKNDESLHRIDAVMTSEQLAQLTPAPDDQVELPDHSGTFYVHNRRWRYGKKGLLGVEVKVGRAMRRGGRLR